MSCRRMSRSPDGPPSPHRARSPPARARRWESWGRSPLPRDGVVDGGGTCLHCPPGSVGEPGGDAQPGQLLDHEHQWAQNHRRRHARRPPRGCAAVPVASRSSRVRPAARSTRANTAPPSSRHPRKDRARRASRGGVEKELVAHRQPVLSCVKVRAQSRSVGAGDLGNEHRLGGWPAISPASPRRTNRAAASSPRSAPCSSRTSRTRPGPRSRRARFTSRGCGWPASQRSPCRSGC